MLHAQRGGANSSPSLYALHYLCVKPEHQPGLSEQNFAAFDWLLCTLVVYAPFAVSEITCRVQFLHHLLGNYFWSTDCQESLNSYLKLPPNIFKPMAEQDSPPALL